MKLTKRDSETLAAALLEPNPQPNEALKRAAREHDEYRRRSVVESESDGKRRR